MPASESLRHALDMHNTGVKIMRQNLRRAMPDASPSEVEQRLVEWLHTRPGAESGDCAGEAVGGDRP